MKCEEVLAALNDDITNLEAVRRHLKSCPECTSKYADDIKIEESLRNLAQEPTPIDITDELRQSLGVLSDRQYKYHLLRNWVWIAASAAVMILLAVATPVVAGWLAKAYDVAGEVITHSILTDRQNVTRWLESASSYGSHPGIFYLMIAILAWIAIFLGRELKRTT